ncbi:type II toxin-antitoxin system PemK/MazF family toxin, partial [Cellulomonas massiliensis]|uniref:type II toxin-antitoxin system PemK/MazF family toxin n=1 Tax=Cellulomonas massiliensis TaxID=1465811 RepID=UPI001FE393DE
PAGAPPTTASTGPAPAPGVARTPRAPAAPDHRGPVAPQYAPRLHDGDADPGEVVWTWVPYEDDPTQGKDRPVVVLARDGADVLALMLTSKDHDRDAAREARRGRYWLDVGAGDWDARRRPSEVRVDRVLRLDPRAIRREGAVLDRAVFDEVCRARAAFEAHGAVPPGPAAR